MVRFGLSIRMVGSLSQKPQKKEDTMTIVKKPILRKQHADEVCNVCGKPSRDTLCEACVAKVRSEALARKKHEEQGN
jgi:recombinational DNA repair protein RecR